MLLTSAGEPSKVRRSFSKISTPSNPTAAAACSFSGKEPLRQTVAIALGRGVKDVVIVARPSSWRNPLRTLVSSHLPPQASRQCALGRCLRAPLLWGSGSALGGAACCAAIAGGRGQSLRQRCRLRPRQHSKRLHALASPVPAK